MIHHVENRDGFKWAVGELPDATKIQVGKNLLQRFENHYRIDVIAPAHILPMKKEDIMNYFMLAVIEFDK